MNARETSGKQRLVVLYDGTWNKPDDQTNVYHLAGNICDFDGSIRQRFFYDPGVGTGRFDHIRGGMLGYGLDDNLRQGYEWLCYNYSGDDQVSDEIYLFGFSRGAYTARSLGGMIRKCGLLKIVTPGLLEDAMELYRDRKVAPGDKKAIAFREKYARKPEVRIHMIGVWDTVGALGIPGLSLSQKRYRWHDTRISRIVDHAYQAMALDEHRRIFHNVPWTTETGDKKADNVKVEQRWFIGAHSNVGGGYKDQDLSDIALKWMQEKATEAGLKLDPVEVDEKAYTKKPVDSLKNFAGGVYFYIRKLFKRNKARFYRPFDTDSKGNKAINVTVDESVWKRWREDEKYRPPTLVDAGIEPPA